MMCWTQGAVNGSIQLADDADWYDAGNAADDGEGADAHDSCYGAMSMAMMPTTMTAIAVRFRVTFITPIMVCTSYVAYSLLSTHAIPSE